MPRGTGVGSVIRWRVTTLLLRDSVAPLRWPTPCGGLLPLAHAGRDEFLDDSYALLARRHGRRNVAGSMLAGRLGNAVILPTVAAMILDGQCPDPAADNLTVRIDDDGHVDRVGVRTPAGAAPTDRPAACPDSVAVADEAALHAWSARRAAATLTPLLAAVRGRAPFSLRHLWGVVADEVTGTARCGSPSSPVRTATPRGSGHDCCSTPGPRPHRCR